MVDPLKVLRSAYLQTTALSLEGHPSRRLGFLDENLKLKNELDLFYDQPELSPENSIRVLWIRAELCSIHNQITFKVWQETVAAAANYVPTGVVCNAPKAKAMPGPIVIPSICFPYR